MFFYLFSFLIILSALGVILSKNPIHSVLWLIFAFLNSSGIFLLLGAEFLAMMMIIVYVGAVAVLLLFMVMMLDTDFSSINLQPPKSTLILGVLITLCMIFNISTLISHSLQNKKLVSNSLYTIDPASNLTNTEMIGDVLYGDFFIPFQTAGVILFVAIVGAITLTVSKTSSMKKQNVAKQLARDKISSISLVKIENNSAVKGINYDL
jgi:NADH-quinone oxidoreductase subunit J